MAEPFVGAVDWGTSSFRLWVLDRDGIVLAEESHSYGVERYSQHGVFGFGIDSNIYRPGMAPADVEIRAREAFVSLSRCV